MAEIETDYLVVGAGATGMAFTDALIGHSDADVVMVDRHHRPGGHWNDDYPFVRLHQPSAMYGVASRTLGEDRVDQVGLNAGYYERATAAELCDYYGRVLDEQMLPSGQVRFFGMHSYTWDTSAGDAHVIRSRITGEATTVRVRKRLVDSTYMESSLPSTHAPSFPVEPDARFVAPNDLVDLGDSASGFTVIGAGKTSMDTCYWLLDNGVDPDAIRWVRPRDAWTNDRGSIQLKEQIGSFIEWITAQNEACAEADGVDDLFRRLEDHDVLHRLDPDVEPAFFRGAILCEAERVALRQITDIVRQGKVRSVSTDRLELEGGSVRTEPGRVHIDCTASGLGSRPSRPAFEPGHLTVQLLQSGILPFSAAALGFVEAVKDDDTEKNRLCPTIAFDPAADPRNFAVGWRNTQNVVQGFMADPDVGPWLSTCRLSAFGLSGEYLAQPEIGAAFGRMLESGGAAMASLDRMLATHDDRLHA